MTQTKLSSHKLNSCLLLLAAASLFSLIIAQVSHRAEAPAYAAPVQTTVFWHAGNFRYLDSMSGDLLTFVQGLQHPNSGGYGKLSTTRKGNFNAFLDALFSAIDASLADGSTGDWCGVKTAAATAGYAVYRFYDTTTGRWFVYGQDTTSFGQSYFFINPFAKRNIVIEVPHEDYEINTKAEGVKLFRSLAARALIINKEHRCSDPDTSACAVGQTTSACSDGRIRESDVAHHTANTFYLLHKRYTDMDPVTKFVQLHGMGGSSSDMAEIGDGTTRDVNIASVSVAFANNLDRFVPSPSAVDSCQESTGNPPSALCAETNVEGRYTNNQDASDCPASSSADGMRFIAVEQALTLRDDDDSDGWYWGDVRDALIATWPDCNMNNGATDCTLGPQQTQYSGLSCSGTLSAKVTFYSYPDNDSGSGTTGGTNVIADALDWQGHSRHRNAQGQAIAGGVGTFTDPITVAAVAGNTTYAPGTLIYLPGLKKYFLVEDSCRNCTSNWIDLWMESNATNSAETVTQCEFAWTADVTQPKDVWLNPSSALQVDATSFFNVGANQCNPVTWY